MQANTTVWTKDSVQALIARNDRALARALWQIYQRQTDSERAAQQTLVHNKVGFTGTDARFLSDVARRLPQYEFRMTARQIAKIRPKMLKYWRQLLDIIEQNGRQVSRKAPKREIANEPEGDMAILLKPVPPSQPGVWGSF